MGKASKFFNVIYYCIRKWNSVTIKDVNAFQICKLNTAENSSRSISGGTEVALKFTEESQGLRRIEPSEEPKSGGVTPNSGELQRWGTRRLGTDRRGGQHGVGGGPGRP